MKIAFQSDRDGNDEIYVMSADGSNQTRLTNNPASDTSPTWSPDGTRIAFVSNRDGDPNIYVMNADGTGVTKLTSDPGVDENPTYSPDGSKIAFDSDRAGQPQIFVMNTNGTSQTNLSNNGSSEIDPSSRPAALPSPSSAARQVSRRSGRWRLTDLVAHTSTPGWEHSAAHRSHQTDPRSQFLRTLSGTPYWC